MRPGGVGLLVAAAVLLIEQQSGALGVDEVLVAGVLGALAVGISARGAGRS